MQMDLVGYAIVQPAMTVDDVVYHPCGGRTADDEFHIGLAARPSVPEEVESRDETGFGRVEAGHLVYEHDYMLLTDTRLYNFPQGGECLHPVFRPFPRVAALRKRQSETGKLCLHVPVDDAGHVKIQHLPQRLCDEKRLAYAPRP